MNNKFNLKRSALCAVLAAGMIVPSLPVIAADEPQLKAEAAYGTPVIDGEIDEVWNNAPAYTIEKDSSSSGNKYVGWFKLMWDDDNLYVLSRVYSASLDNSDSSPWNHDSLEIFVDEKHDMTTAYGDDDYQLRVGYDEAKSGTASYNFDNMNAKTKLTDNGFYIEEAIPFLTVKPKDKMTIGFDVQINTSATLAFARGVYRWSERKAAIYSNNSVMGSATLKTAPNVPVFNEPTWEAPKAVPYSTKTEPDTFEMIDGVKTTFDGNSFYYPILHINEYPAMAIEDLAKVIGATVEGNTLIKDRYRLTFVEGSKLAEDEKGHFMLERKPKRWTDGRLYIPVSFVKPYLTYNMFYDRFGKTLEMSSGTNYPDTEKVFYARDFGARGDGVHDDGPAITKALNAAMNSGVPSKVELDEGKTYLIGDRVDSFSYFVIEDTENLIFEGNHSTIMFKRPTNTFIQISRCRNVKVRNMDIDAIEPYATYGKVLSVDSEANSFQMEIPEGMPLPADDDWVHYYYTDARSGGWWFGYVYNDDATMRFTDIDAMFPQTVKHVSGRIYEVTMKSNHAKFVEVGDNFALNSRMSAYDIGDHDGRGGSTSAIWSDCSADIEFDGVYVYSTGWMFCGIGLSEGKHTFRNSGFKMREGRMLCVNSDGIHTWLNRGSLVLENCTFMNNLDDHFNTYTQGGFVSKIINNSTFETAGEINGRVGDEVQVYDRTTMRMLGRAFIKEYEKIPGGNARRITLDREFEGVKSLETTSTPTLMYVMDSGSRGNSVRGCKFINSRRYAILNRAANSLFEDNKVIGCGAGLAAQNEFTTATKSEGGFPSTNTFRNNYIESTGGTNKYYPFEAWSWAAKPGDSAGIDGMLVENNEINVPNAKGSMNFIGVHDLYLINNKLTNKRDAEQKAIPISFINCGVTLIDGLEVDYESDMQAMSFIGCDIDPANIKNIKITGNSSKEYTIE